jgi:hypothetical protein
LAGVSVSQKEMVWRDFAGDPRAVFLGLADQFDLCLARDVAAVKAAVEQAG